MTAISDAAVLAFRDAYAEHRAAEGRGHQGIELFDLPYLKHGPLARQWQVRARSFDRLVSSIVTPMAAAQPTRLRVADLGAGNGWLSHRLACAGHDCTAIDIRDDDVDGLGAARPLQRWAPFETMVASFDALPFVDHAFDLVIFNAALHYATDLSATIAEAARVVRPGGQLVIVDSPFYRRDRDGAAMVAEKHASAAARFGDRADELLALPFIEYLTVDRLAAAAPLRWRRHRVRYPLWYELRPLKAALGGKRVPSRFDIWSATVR